ncbi:MAG: flagellar export chaperone FlgN [Granulosicoccus sp.]
MNDLTKKTVSTSKDDSQPALIRLTEHLVTEFERLLASELYLLKNGQTIGLEAIADAKQALIDQFASLEVDLIDLFETQSEHASIKTLKQRLSQCRIDNRSNHGLVMLEIKHANKSLELLRTVLNMDDLSLYSERGEVQVNREKRKIGSA